MAHARRKSTLTWPPNLGRNAEPKDKLPPLAFIHIPKTAGTSVTHTLAQIYGEMTFPGMTTLDYPHYTDEQLSQYRFYKGHAYRRDYDRFPKETLKFTVMREPTERVLSWFNYNRELDDAHITDEFIYEASRLARNNGIIEFIHSDAPFIIEHIRMGQMRQFLSPPTLASIGHRLTLSRSMRQTVLQEFVEQMDRMHVVLTSEMLFLSFPLMMDQLGFSNGKQLARLNVSKHRADVDMVDARRALTEVNGVEFAAYEHVRRRELVWIAENLHRLVALQQNFDDDKGQAGPDQPRETDSSIKRALV